MIEYIAPALTACVAIAAWVNLVRAISASRSAVETRVEVLATEVRADRDAARERGSGFAAAIDGLGTRLGGLHSEVVGIRETVTELREARAATETRCEAHAGRLLRLEGTVNGGGRAASGGRG